MKTIQSVGVAIVLLFGSLVSLPAHAGEDEALMIIRFNNETVQYQRSLKRLVNKALNIKPTTFFDIVSLTPDSQQSVKKGNQHLTKYRTDSVISHIKRFGVLPDNIRVTYQNSARIDSDEVHIFVR